ncbi:MAG TPA: DUF222 domain-containing protein [Nakamurella sp.]|nr:DUF222 domain-containing protein [Nakamurella sp.]
MTGRGQQVGGDGVSGARVAATGAARCTGSGDGAAGAGVFSAVDAERCAGMPTPACDGPTGFGGMSADDPAAVSAALAEAGRELAAIRSSIARLRDLPLWTVREQDLLTLARDVESTVWSAYGVQVRLAGEISERGVAQTLSVRSPAQLLRQTLNIPIGQARGRVTAARACLPSDTPSGQTMPPPLPELLHAIDAGALSDHHARIITGCWTPIPAAVDEQTRGMCRDLLLTEATRRDPDGLRQVADHIANIVDPDGTADDRDPADHAELHIGGKRPDGLTPIRGLLSPLTAEQLRIAIEALAAPTPIDAHPRPTPRPDHPRQGLHLARLRHPPSLVRRPPCDLVVPRRTHRHHQRRPTLPPTPHPHPPRTLAGPPRHRRQTRIHPPTTHRPHPTTQTQPPLPPPRPPQQRVELAHSCCGPRRFVRGIAEPGVVHT